MSEQVSDFDVIRNALRRLNPQFHEIDSAWPALERIQSRLSAAKVVVAAAKALACINLMENWRLDGHAAGSYVAAVYPRWVALLDSIRRYEGGK